MSTRLRAAGADAVLVELPDPQTRRRLHHALSTTDVDGLAELVPASATVLVRATSPQRLPGLVGQLRSILSAGLPEIATDAVDPITIEVSYDGEDIANVAEICGISVDEVIARHTGQLWTVEFAGFMPGFGYLSGDVGGLTVPRLTSPRTRIPPGSVALAGEFTGIYPQASPGGWQLIGTTDAELWRTDRVPPALLSPGARIQFVEVK